MLLMANSKNFRRVWRGVDQGLYGTVNWCVGYDGLVEKEEEEEEDTWLALM